MKTFSKHYTDHELCLLHDKYMRLYDTLTDTEFEWILTANYSRLLELMVESEFIGCSKAAQAAAFMLVYKQNVCHIDGANEKRREDAMLAKQLLVVIKNDCNNQLWRHNGELCIPHELKDEMGWDDDMLNGYLLQAFGKAYKYNGEDWVLNKD